MLSSLLANTPLADLADTHGWFTVSTPLEAGGKVQSIVYVDGDVTTKLFDSRTCSERDLATHFSTIDAQSARVRRRLRAIAATLIGVWCALAAALVVAARDPASLAGAVAILLPMGIVAVQRVLRRTLTTAAPLVAVIAAAVALLASVVLDLPDLRVPASVALVVNLALVIVFAVLRARLRTFLGGVVQ